MHVRLYIDVFDLEVVVEGKIGDQEVDDDKRQIHNKPFA